MSWWAITEYLQQRQPYALLIGFFTDVPITLYMAHDSVPPALHPVYKRERGIEVFRGYQHAWGRPTIKKQEPHPNPLYHQFYVTDLPAAWSLWFYFFSHPGPYGQEVQTPLIYEIFSPP